MFAVSTNSFEGPLSLLLELIEAEKMDISQVALGQVTESYLRYLEQQPGMAPEEMADFLVVATKLVLIKSRLLLPELPVIEEQGPSLEEQLRLYRNYAEAAKVLALRLSSGLVMYSHEKLPVFEIGFVPPSKFGLEQMQLMMCGVLKKITPIQQLPNAAIEAVVSIHDKIAEFRNILATAKRASFGQILQRAQSRTEMVVCFLALLELVKQRSVLVEQDGQFADIMLCRVTQSEVVTV